jgi:hypothetical protein
MDNSAATDAFKDRLSQRARDTSRPALAHQSRGRALTVAERALAAALERIYGEGTHDFAAVAEALRTAGVTAPGAGTTDWTADLLESELAAINADLDAAYEAHGYGA